MKIRGTIRPQLSVHAPDDAFRQDAKKPIDRVVVRNGKTMQGRGPTDMVSAMTFDEIAAVMTQCKDDKMSGATAVTHYKSGISKLADALPDIYEEAEELGIESGRVEELFAEVLSEMNREVA